MKFQEYINIRFANFKTIASVKANPFEPPQKYLNVVHHHFNF